VYAFEDANGRVICPVFDARRDQIYSAALPGILPTGAYRPEQFIDELCGKMPGTIYKITFCCDGLTVYEERMRIALAEKGIDPEGCDWRPDVHAKAEYVSMWAAEHGKRIDYQELVPVYVRKAEAQRKLEERMASEAQVSQK
jgi:tRNA A37 threonylcarbamoyladenosine modification protein TsaB